MNRKGNLMTMEQLMKNIHLPEKGQQAVKDYKIEEEEYQRLKELAYRDEKAFFKKAGTYSDKERLYLYLYIRMAAEQCEKIRSERITEEAVNKEAVNEEAVNEEAVYLDSCCDIALWYHHCVKEKKKCGVVEEQWLLKIVTGKVIRLGRLQFEPDGQILHVHIPEGSPLIREECDQSFKRAREFFGPSYLYFDCYSWLLSPALKEFMDEDSNIMRFQNRFQIHAVYYGYRQAEERIFGYIAEDKNTYPENTTLQKKAKAYYLEGKDIGMGYGVIDYYK